MFEKILVPLDGSNAAEMALPYAEEIAAKVGSEIILVAVSEAGVAEAGHLYCSYLEHITGEVERQLKDYGARKGAKVNNEALLGAPAAEIVRYADRNNIGLIVMSSHGATGQGPWILGNVASKVLRAATRPVMLIKERARRADVQEKRLISKILVPLDGSTVGEAAIPYSETLAGALDAEIVLFQVNEPLKIWGQAESSITVNFAQVMEARKVAETAYLEDKAKVIREKGLRVSTVVETGSPAEGILDYAKANDIDLVAMSSHGRSGVGRWVFGSVADKVLHYGDIPVLVARSPKT